MPARSSRGGARLAALLTAATLAPYAAARQVRYNAEVFAPPGSQPSLYAFGMNEQGVIVGRAGDDRYDPRAAPIAVLNGRVVEGQRPNESLNFLFGLGRADLVVGASATFPFVWKRGVPQQLRPAGGLPQGSAYDANTRGVICGEVYRDLNNLIRNASEPILYVSNAVAIDSRGRIAAEVQVADGFGTATRIALLTPAP